MRDALLYFSGADPQSVEAAHKAIMEIVGAPADDYVKVLALKMLRDMCEPKSTFTNCTIAERVVGK